MSRTFGFENWHRLGYLEAEDQEGCWEPLPVAPRWCSRESISLLSLESSAQAEDHQRLKTGSRWWGSKRILNSLAQTRPFDLLVSHVWSIFNTGPKRLTFYFWVLWATALWYVRCVASNHCNPLTMITKLGGLKTVIYWGPFPPKTVT